MKNYYEILRVRTNATQQQIKSAFINLVSQYHPDIYEGDKIYAEQYTSLITEAYTVLKDPEKRREYDLKNDICSCQSRSDFRREDREIKREIREETRVSGKNYEQQMSMKYFKNNERKKSSKRNILQKIFTSKLFYCLLFVFAIEFLIIYLIYSA